MGERVGARPESSGAMASCAIVTGRDVVGRFAPHQRIAAIVTAHA